MPNRTRAAEMLVIDDEPDLRTLYELTLIREGHRVTSAATLAEAREILGEQRFDVVLTDMRLPDGLGMNLLRELAQQKRTERCIVVTAYGSAENAVEALKAGAFDYLTKPVDIQQLRDVVQSACVAAPRSASSSAASASSHDASIPDALTAMIGDSAAMRRVKLRIQRVGQSMAPVLIYGESGTGKELAARALHACSHRAHGPFVAVNCAAIPESLLEAEFFGARKGSYTGANADREGFFQAARGGTLFLDEIGELPLAMQSKLLRAIQERKVRALGSNVEEPTDVRVVSATHRNLAAMVEANSFRQDLYFRVNVIELRMPPLRERREDLPALCAAILERIARDSGRPAAVLSARSLKAIGSMELPGNVRELENLLHRAWALHESGPLELDEFANSAFASDSLLIEDLKEPVEVFADLTLPEAAKTGGSDAELPSDLQGFLDAQERTILIEALQRTRYNRTAAAAMLGITLRQIRYRIERLGIELPNGDSSGDRDGA